MNRNNGLESLHYPKSFVTNMQRVPLSKNPTLIVTLGGQGAKAAVQLKATILENAQLTDGKLPENVEILAIDSDRTIENLNHNGVQLDTNEIYISDLNLRYDFEHRNALSSEIRSFLNPMTTFISPPGTGCAGKRVASKVMLFEEIMGQGNKNLISKIVGKVKRICTGNELPPILVFVGGAGGGTCSGMFFDVAYLVKAVFNKITGEGNKATSYGYLFMPDLLSVDESVKKNTYANTAAFLQEFCYLQSMKTMDERYVQKYTSEYEIDTNQPPVDFMHIEGGTGMDGVLIPNADTHCLEVVTQSILSYLTDEEVEATETNSSLASHYSNVHTYNTNFTSKDPYGKSCEGVSMGSASMRLPTGELSKMIAAGAFQRMERLYSNEPSSQDIAETVRTLRIDIDEQVALFKERVAGFKPYKEDFTYDEIFRAHTVNIRDYLMKRYIQPVNEELPVVAKKQQVAFEQLVDELFSNYAKQINKGHIYVSRLMSNSHELTIIEAMDNYRNRLDEDIRELEKEADIFERKALSAYHEAEKAFLEKEKKKDIYVEYLLHWADIKVECEIRRQLKLQYQSYIDFLSNRNSNIYGVVTKLLEELKKIFDENDVAATEGVETVTEQGREYVWTVLDNKLLERAVNKELERIVSADELLRDFMQRLTDQLDLWVGEEADVAEFIREFIQEEFADMLSISLTKCIEQEAMVKRGLTKEYDLYGNAQNEEIDLEEYIKSEIIPNLIKRAQPLFPVKTVGNMQTATAIYISVPKNPGCDVIYKAFKEAQKDNQACVIKRSAAIDRITVVNCTCGIPLYRWAPINEMLKAYEENLSSVITNGRHLCATPENNWEQLPTVYPPEAWVIDNFKSEHIMKQVNDRKAILKRALELNVIYTKMTDDGKSGYYIRQTKSFEQPNISDINTMDKGVLVEQILRYDEINQNGFETETDLVGVPIIKCFMGASDTKTLEKVFMNSYQLYLLTVCEVKKKEELSGVIETLKKKMEQIRNAGAEFRQFIKLLYTKTVALLPNSTKYVFTNQSDQMNALELMDKREAGKYAEYELYRILQTHPLVEEMNQAADVMNKELSLHTDELKANIKQILADVKRKCMDAKMDECFAENGKECNAFYQGCKAILEEELSYLD